MIIMVKSLWHFTKLFVFERQKRKVCTLDTSRCLNKWRQ